MQRCVQSAGVQGAVTGDTHPGVPEPPSVSGETVLCALVAPGVSWAGHAGRTAPSAASPLPGLTGGVSPSQTQPRRRPEPAPRACGPRTGRRRAASASAPCAGGACAPAAAAGPWPVPCASSWSKCSPPRGARPGGGPGRARSFLREASAHGWPALLEAIGKGGQVHRRCPRVPARLLMGCRAGNGASFLLLECTCVRACV